MGNGVDDRPHWQRGRMGRRLIRAVPALLRRPTVPYPGAHAATTPDKPAVVMAGSGETLTYARLDERSTRLAARLRGSACSPATSSHR